MSFLGSYPANLPKYGYIPGKKIGIDYARLVEHVNYIMLTTYMIGRGTDKRVYSRKPVFTKKRKLIPVTAFDWNWIADILKKIYDALQKMPVPAGDVDKASGTETSLVKNVTTIFQDLAVYNATEGYFILMTDPNAIWD